MQKSGPLIPLCASAPPRAPFCLGSAWNTKGDPYFPASRERCTVSHEAGKWGCFPVSPVGEEGRDESRPYDVRVDGVVLERWVIPDKPRLVRPVHLDPSGVAPLGFLAQCCGCDWVVSWAGGSSSLPWVSGTGVRSELFSCPSPCTGGVFAGWGLQGKVRTSLPVVVPLSRARWASATWSMGNGWTERGGREPSVRPDWRVAAPWARRSWRSKR